MPNETERVAKWLWDTYSLAGRQWEDTDESDKWGFRQRAAELLAMIRPTPASVVQRPTPEPVVWRFKRPDGRWEYDEGVGPPKIVGGVEAWEAKGWIFEALYNDKEVGE